ncbi:hypothetical protein CTI12_AA064630 [Artemisia annua]|uniref:Uncharacterized protein n=1 Tax=Artemisia annua TaxID=35608 RepID=A0A2U1P6J7_ARTAN|nr:hypothetical protein CTI12_AA064630 [Artemisia annua]
MELEDEERKLQETLEYPKIIEHEAKQRHIAEQHKSSSRVTPTGNPVDDEWKPFRLEPIKQNNGAWSPLENDLCNAKDGFLERTGTDSLITHNALLVFCETWFEVWVVQICKIEVGKIELGTLAISIVWVKKLTSACAADRCLMLSTCFDFQYVAISITCYTS